MGFIVIEGLDGSGKSTQIKLIEDYFQRKKIRTRYIHFPRTDTPVWGELISRFLQGDMGRLDSVNPYLVALLYAGDRKDFAPQIEAWMKEGYMVIADRYLYSNIAYQCAKLTGEKEKEKLALWIKNFEYNYNNIPLPDLNLFLNVPFKFTEKSLTTSRDGSDRSYLNGNTDIHEADLIFQQRVREIYLWQVKVNEDFDVVDCCDKQGNMLKASEISGLIINKIEHKKLIHDSRNY